MKNILFALVAAALSLASLTSIHADTCTDDCAVDPQIVIGGH